MRNSDDKAITLRWACTPICILSTTAASFDQQHQRLSSINASAASLHQQHQQHQRISSISSIIGSTASAHQYHQQHQHHQEHQQHQISAHIHQVRSYQHMSINTIRHASRHHQTPSDMMVQTPPDTTTHASCMVCMV